MKFKTDPCSCGYSVSAVIVCAGKGERTGLPYNKVLHVIGKKTVLETVLDTFTQTGIFDRITVVSSETDKPRIADIASRYDGVSVVIGGATRSESVLNGLLDYRSDIVVIHDGARPYASAELIKRSIISAAKKGSGIAAVKCTDTVKRRTDDGKVISLPRSELYNTQTPQTFVYDRILEAYRKTEGAFTDDAEVYENAGFSPVLIDGEYENIKITTATDLMRELPGEYRIGAGFDVHRLVENRPLILGGTEIKYELGLLGHSDADVLTHAVMDALLSAAGCPDIGVLFPDTDDKYKGISSLLLLEQVVKLVDERGYDIKNISAVVAAQRPKLAPHILDIRATLAKTLGIDIERINISATTTEQLGLIGEGKAIAANATCLLSEKTPNEESK